MNPTKQKLQSVSTTLEKTKTQLKNLKLRESSQDSIEIESLKQMQKSLQKEKQKQKELYQVESFVNFTEYTKQKKRKNGDPNGALADIEDKRIKARETFQKQKELEEIYNKYDSKTYPAFLFFANEVLQHYGNCPFTNILDFKLKGGGGGNIQLQNVSELEKKRKFWLDKQKDHGELYMNLYNRIVLFSNLQNFFKTKDKLIHECHTILSSVLSASQMKMYMDSREYLNQYTKAVVKSKKVKELYSNVVNNCSMLKSETDLDVHNYLTALYDVQILVNHISKDNFKESILGVNEESEPSNKNLSRMLYSTIEKLVECKSSIETETKFINNSKNYCFNEMVDYILKEESKESFANETFVQKGMYFCKWSELTSEQKYERLLSYAKYYIYKFFTSTQIYENLDSEELVDKFYNTIKDGLDSKILKYKDFKWNQSHGVISNISGVTFDNEKCEFTLNLSCAPQKKSNSKSRSSSKTIITKSHDKLINDIILTSILKSVDKNDIINKIKDKLKVNKLSSNDKQTILQKYNDICLIVQENESESV
jgi:hypothetical protein